MTAMEYLSQAYRLDQMIRSDMAEAAGLRELASSAGSPDYKEHFNPNAPAEAPFERSLLCIWEIEQRIQEEISRLAMLREQIHAVIAAVENPDERMLLSCRYIQGMTWGQIMEELHVGRTTVYRWHKSALKHVKIPNNPATI